MRLPYPFAKRLSDPAIPGERARIETGLAWARLVLATACLFAIILDPTEPTRYGSVAYAILIVYLVHCIGVIVFLRGSIEVSERFAYMVQAIDLAVPAAITIFTEGPNSPFFVVFFFAIMEAAFRWGFRASFVNTVIALAVQVTEVAVLVWGTLASRFVDTPFELNRLVIRVSYLAITGLVVGYAAEQEKQLRAETTLIARLSERARSSEGSLNQAIQSVFTEMLQIFSARALLLAVRDIASGRVFCWWIEQPSPDDAPTLRVSEPDFDSRDTYMFPSPADTWIAMRSQADIVADAWHVSAIDTTGRTLRDLPRFEPPAGAPFADCRHSLMGVSFTLGTTFHGRVLLRDPEMVGGVITELRFVQKMLQQVGPAIYNLYLVRRLRSRAGAIQRARTARELHDGAIQSLIGAEMQVDVLRRRASAGTGVSGKDLERIQEILRHEVLGLRELMQEMRPVDVGPRDLLDFLSNLVDRFRRDTGIHARFITGLDEVTLSPRLCREVVRIAQEALFNVRRHSEAQNVMIRFHTDGAFWKLEIEDDGRGFGFSGRLTGTQMDASHQGPQVIRERVRQIGGELVIESTPGRGAKLEIALPQPKVRATYA